MAPTDATPRSLSLSKGRTVRERAGILIDAAISITRGRFGG
ncbi:hypothetical protein [Planctomonas psychrotolerans]|nr:hypothetical protein [Planctomonas psychrotolerans]